MEILYGVLFVGGIILCIVADLAEKKIEKERSERLGGRFEK